MTTKNKHSFRMRPPVGIIVSPIGQFGDVALLTRPAPTDRKPFSCNIVLVHQTLRIFGTIAAWTLTVLLAFLFAYVGGAKLTSNPSMVREFAQIGFGQWFRYLVGSLEVSGAIAVLIPRLRFWGALLIAAVMVGATIANLSILHIPPLAGLTAVLLALALALAWLRRPRSAPTEKAALP
jgi:putative oxidoreductase